MSTLAQATDGLANGPDAADTHLARAFSALNGGRPREALEAADRALALGPTAKALEARALALLRLGKSKKALSAAKDAQRIAPMDANGHFVEAVVWRKFGVWSKADAAYQAALELAPSSLRLLTSYGTMLEQRGQLAEAEALADRCSAIRRDDPETLLLLGRLALARGRRPEAVDRARWALSLDARNPAAIALLSRAEMPAHSWLTRWIRFASASHHRLIGCAIVLGLTLAIVSSALRLPEQVVKIGYWTVIGCLAIFMVASDMRVRSRVKTMTRNVRLRRGF